MIGLRRWAPATVAGKSLRALLLALTLFAASTTPGQDWSVDWYTIDSGGEVLSETADSRWRLSGSIGQPDATGSGALTGGRWSVTGGFWPVATETSEVLFRDSFEDQ